MPAMPYHVLLDDEPRGPHSTEALAEMAARGEIDGRTLVWQAGMNDWVPAASVPALAHLFDDISVAPVPVSPRATIALDITAALTIGFTAYRKAPQPTIVVSILYNVLPVLVFMPLFLLLSIGRETDDLLRYLQSGEGQIAMMSLGLTLGITMAIFYGGLCAFMLALIRGQPVHTKMLYLGFRRAGALAGFAVLYLIGVVAGLMMLVVPGIVIAVGFCLTPFIIMESGLGALSAMAASWRAVLQLDWWRVFAVFIALFMAFMALVFIMEMIQTILAGIASAAPMMVLILALNLAVNIVVIIVAGATFAAVYEQARRNRISA